MTGAPPGNGWVPFSHPLKERDSTHGYWVSESQNDPHWDAWLVSQPHGTFQQSTRWAEVKGSEGWRSVRLAVSRGHEIVAGAHFLARRSLLGRIGYISKGPIVDPASGYSLARMVGFVAAVARQRLTATVIQPSDDLPIPIETAREHHLQENKILPLIAATCLVSVAGNPSDLETQMNKSTRNRVRQSERRGIAVREGTRADLAVFHRLMVVSCERQGERPDPAKVESLYQVWDAFTPARACRLLLAECEGQPVAALACLGFANRLTLWKKGWTGEFRDRQPNAALTYAALRGAQEAGYTWADFLAMERDLAEALLRGTELDDRLLASRDHFNLGFGGRPVLLPTAWLCFRHPWMAAVCRTGWGLRLARRMRRLASQ